MYDGKRAAWSSTDLGDGTLFTVTDINLDEEQGRPPRQKPDIMDLRVIKAKRVDISHLQIYMNGKTSWDVSVLEAINFFNHLMRIGPSRKFINFGGSYFRREIQDKRDMADLGPYNEAYKGVYQSIRPAQGGKLIVNVDVSNGAFWKYGHMINHAVNLLHLNNVDTMVGHLLANDVNRQKNVQGWNNTLAARRKEAEGMLSRRLKGVTFTSSCQAEGQRRVYRVQSILYPNAQEQKVKVKINSHEETMTLEQFYKKKFKNAVFKYPTLPLVRTAKPGIVFPLEFCIVERDQRFIHKLTPDQTARMINFAVTDGHDRAQRVRLGAQMMNWKDDHWLKQYQLLVDQQMIKTNARILPPPHVNYDPTSRGRNNQMERKVIVSDGRWNLQGKKFVKKGQLDSWGILVLTRYAQQRFKKGPGDQEDDPRNYASPQVTGAINSFLMQLGNCGVRLGPNAKNPVLQGFNGQNATQSTQKLADACLNRFKTPPQLLCFICYDKSTEPYATIKKYCDTVLGVVSQGEQVSSPIIITRKRLTHL